jgi:hypothetical protein
MRNPDFREWLTGRGYTRASARDYVSRLKRAVELNHESGVALSSVPADEFIMHLERNDEFRGLTTSVKSHLRKTVRLYKEFEGGQPH